MVTTEGESREVFSRLAEIRQEWLAQRSRRKRKALWRRASQGRGQGQARLDELQAIAKKSYRQRLDELELRASISRHPASAPRDGQAGERDQHAGDGRADGRDL